MNFDFGTVTRSKKAKTNVSHNVTMTNDQILNYLFEIKQKIDMLYHTCSMSHLSKKEKADEEEEEEYYKSNLNQEPKVVFNGFQTNSNNIFTFNTQSCKRKDEQIEPLAMNNTPMGSFPLLVSKKHLTKQKLLDNDFKSKQVRSLHYSTLPNPVLNNTFSGGLVEARTDGSDVSMY